MTRKITEIIVHCSATAPGWMDGKPLADKIAEIDRWHRAEDWGGIGYHYVIDRNGEMLPGRSQNKVGAHVKGRNATTLGICLLGGRGSSANDAPETHYTPEQLEELRRLIDSLRDVYGDIPVTGHNQYAARACPGFNVPRWFAGQGPRKLTESRTIIGQAVAGTGTAGASAIELLASDVTTAQTAVQGAMEYLPMLKWVFVALMFAGIALTVYARVDDWKRGRK